MQNTSFNYALGAVNRVVLSRGTLVTEKPTPHVLADRGARYAWEALIAPTVAQACYFHRLARTCWAQANS